MTNTHDDSAQLDSSMCHDTSDVCFGRAEGTRRSSLGTSNCNAVPPPSAIPVLVDLPAREPLVEGLPGRRLTFCRVPTTGTARTAGTHQPDDHRHDADDDEQPPQPHPTHAETATRAMKPPPGRTWNPESASRRLSEHRSNGQAVGAGYSWSRWFVSEPGRWANEHQIAGNATGKK